jgi:hypothetical protein
VSSRYNYLGREGEWKNASVLLWPAASGQFAS